MKKILLAAALAATALLAGCGDGQQQQRAIERSEIQELLPAGCRFIPLRSYASQSVNVVVCSGRGTTTTITDWTTQSGKQQIRHSSVSAVIHEGTL